MDDFNLHAYYIYMIKKMKFTLHVIAEFITFHYIFVIYKKYCKNL